MAMAVEKFVHEEEETDADAPVRYLPLTRLYSATSACINPGGGMLSVKVQAREPVVERVAARGGEGERSEPPVIRVYERRRKRRRVDVGCGVGGGVGGLEPALVGGGGIPGEEVGAGRKVAKLRVLDGVRGQVRDKRDFPRQGKADWIEYIKRKRKSDSPSKKRWVE